ncbi:MAG TPA: S8 family serine peptidase [Chthonomonadales bacterium]|nr:S8 family serine peptidase [Chthonomonadales bacterium]
MRTGWRGLLGLAALAGVVLASALRPALAQGVVLEPRNFVPGEIVVRANVGTTADQVRTLADSVNADISRPLGISGFYLLRLRTGSGQPAIAPATIDAARRLRETGRFRWAAPNHIHPWAATTANDPRFNEQWHLPMMNVPRAWDIQRGSSNVVVAVLDSGIQPRHPDLESRLIGGRNFADPANPTDFTDTVGHGTHVAGIAAAATNNGIGIAGVTYENVGLFAAKMGDAGASAAAVTDAVAYLRENFAEAGRRVVMNWSFGTPTASDTPDPDDPFIAAALEGANAGMVVVMAAGNSYEDGNPPVTPAHAAQLHDNILCVAAVGPTRQRAPYSSARRYTTIAAPGGDTSLGLSAGILSTHLNDGYAFQQGTSMAAPACTGVVALLLSADVPAGEVKRVLTESADRLGMAVPNDEYGYGLIDAHEALLRGSVGVLILEPLGTGGRAAQLGITGVPDPVETLQPNIIIRVSQVPPANLTIRIDDPQAQRPPVTDYTIFNITRTATVGQQVVPVSYDVLISRYELTPGTHTIDVTGTVSGRTVSDRRFFIVRPREVPAGRSLMAIPYFVDRDPTEVLAAYFGTNYVLHRWVPAAGAYATASPAGITPGFIPPLAEHPRPDGATASSYPIGLGFWADNLDAMPKPIVTRGQPQIASTFVIPLKGNGVGAQGAVSWNLIGGPFPFDVPFNACLVQVGGRRMSISTAVAQGLLLPNVYSYDPTAADAGFYSFRTLPDGALRAWTGHWVGVTSRNDIALVVPPLRATRAASNAPVVGTDGWSLQIGASVGRLRDMFNFVGVSSRSVDGVDLADVPKPPAMSPYVAVGSVNEDWGARSGMYARDIRSIGGPRTWTIAVDTDQAESDVTVQWSPRGSLPRNLKLTIKDETTGQVVDMRSRTFTTFRTGSVAAPRRFTITARPALGSVIRITNVSVRTNSGRSAGSAVIGFTLSGDATYEARVLSASGAPVGLIATRAAGAGDVRLVWNGRDSAGRSVPAGTYLVQIRAIGPDGEVVRAVQPFALVR